MVKLAITATLFLALFQATAGLNARRHAGIASRNLISNNIEVEIEDRDLSTNAQRLARGLSPLTPRSILEPNRVVARGTKPSALPHVAPAPAPPAAVRPAGASSPAPASPPAAAPRPAGGSPAPVSHEKEFKEVKQCIKLVKEKKGKIEIVGYVSKDSLHGIFKVTTKLSECLNVYVPEEKGLFDIKLAHESGPKKFLGLAGDDKYQASYLVKSVSTGIDARPSKVYNSSKDFKYSETTIWTKDTKTGKLVSFWWPKVGEKISIRTYLKAENKGTVLYFVTKHDIFKSNEKDAYEVHLEVITV